MLEALAAASLIVTMALGCKKNDSCRELVREVCNESELGSEYCKRVETWLAGAMEASEGEVRQLTPDQRDIACKTIRDNPEVLERYRDEARRAVPPDQTRAP
jgi:hypothetical protein